MNQVWELNRILDEEDGDVVPHNVEVAFVSEAVVDVSSWRRGPRQTRTHNLVAKPCTSLAVSALPLDPATVENRTNVDVCLPASPKKEAAVRLL